MAEGSKFSVASQLVHYVFQVFKYPDTSMATAAHWNNNVSREMTRWTLTI